MHSLKLATITMLVSLSSVAAAANFGREAQVISMDTVPCYQTRGLLTTLVGETTARPEPTMCSEYVLETENVEYHVRPHKNQGLLPVGEPVKFRFTKKYLLVRADDSTEDYEFEVTAMQLKGPKKLAEKRPPALNP